VNANGYLIRGCLCLLAVPAMAGYFPIDTKATYEYEEVTRYGFKDTDHYDTYSIIRRTYSPVVSGSGDPYQRVTDSVFEIDSLTYPEKKTDTLFKIKTYTFSYSDTEIGLDSLFLNFAFQFDHPQLSKGIFSSPLPNANFVIADGVVANACRFPLNGGSENCIKIERGKTNSPPPQSDTSCVVFSENFGIKEAYYFFGGFYGGSNRLVTLKRVLSRADTIDFSNSGVVGLVKRENRARYRDLDVIRRNRPVDINLYSIQGKLLYSRIFGQGEEIDLKGKPENAGIIIHFRTGDP